MKFLKDKTIILNTHLLQYLHNIENIIVLSNGEIKASGTYNELKDKEIATLLLPSANNEENKEIDDKVTENLKSKPTKLLDEELESFEEKESHEMGKVRLDVYKHYIKSIKNIPLVIFVLFLRVLNQSIASFIDYFVAQWVNWEESVASQIKFNNETGNVTLEQNNEETSIDDDRQRFINIYLAIICAFIVIIFKAEFSFFYSLLR